MSARVAARSWTLRRRLGKAYAALVGITILLMAVVVVATTVFVMSGNAAVHRWDPATARTQRLLTDLVDQETGVRGYALTRDRTFLQPYERARTAETEDLAELHRLIRSDRDAKPALDAVQKAAQDWQRTVAAPAVRGIAADDAAAAGVAAAPRAKELFDRIRARAGVLFSTVDHKAAESRNTRRRYLIVFVVALSLTVLVVAAAGLFVWSGMHRWVLAPVERLRDQTRVVAGGQTYTQIVADGPAELTDLGSDVEAMRLQIAGQLARAEEIQEELRVQGAELARSNDDLQQFAYVASHDLSEPLRKVANFCQLLERQYGPQLDDRARQYIDFAVDGAKRMQVLIGDLLALSRVGRTTDEFVPVDLDRALEDALATLAHPIDEAGGRVERLSPLPTVAGDRSLLTSLVENLIGNAIKYRREDEPPVVRIGVEDTGEAWEFTVSDNGIGIEPDYAERIFVVFQRLHLRDKYGGTGIGLALARKIVEFHGGRIWLAPVQSGPGATFRFTLPKGMTLAEPRD
jgi:signal transduction histidine kinase